MSNAKYRRLPSCFTHPFRARSFGSVVGENCGTQSATPVIGEASRYSLGEITPSSFGVDPRWADRAAAARKSIPGFYLRWGGDAEGRGTTFSAGPPVWGRPRWEHSARGPCAGFLLSSLLLS